MSPELFMVRGVRHLRKLDAELDQLLTGWDHLQDGDRRVRVYDLSQRLKNIRSLAENWLVLAEANGVQLPNEDEIDGET
jgi:hypothetical protein